MYAWALYADFEHAVNASFSTVCFATAAWTNGAPAYTYTQLSCPITNNGGGQIGGGQASLNGSGFVTCAVSTPTITSGPPFTVSARGHFPSNGAFTIVDSADFGFSAQRNAGCTLTLSSRYGAINSADASGPLACLGTHTLRSRLARVNGITSLIHRVNNQSANSTPVVGSVTVPTQFNVQIGGPAGSGYSLDDVLIDPSGGHSTGGN
jgi:hypothetical protein